MTNIADCFDTLRAKTPRKITRIFRGVEFNKNKTKGLAGLGQLPDQTDQGGDIGFVGVVALVELAAVGLHSGQLVGVLDGMGQHFGKLGGVIVAVPLP